MLSNVRGFGLLTVTPDWDGSGPITRSLWLGRFDREIPGLDGTTYPPQNSFRVSSQLTFPYPKNHPTAGAESPRVAAVSLPIPGHLLTPSVYVRPR